MISTGFRFTASPEKFGNVMWFSSPSNDAKIFHLLQQVNCGARKRLWRDLGAISFQIHQNDWTRGQGREAMQNLRKKTEEGLRQNGKLDLPWVAAKVTASATGDVKSWNTRLSGCIKAGEYRKAMDLFQKMQKMGIIADSFTYVPVLNACASLRALEQGRNIHALIIKSGCESDAYVGTCLIDMYAKCGNIESAWHVFNKMPTPSVVSWNAIILGCVKCGKGQKALDLYQLMKQEGLEPNTFTFVGVLNACASIAALEEGRSVHEKILQIGYESDVFVGNSLVDMYAKCGSIEDAWRVFKNMPSRNVVAWSAMILGYVKCGHGQKALELYKQMQGEGVEPNLVTYMGVVNACASVAALEEGRCVHEQIIQSGCESDGFVASSLVDMYAKCGSIEDAFRVFNEMPTRNVVAWSALILGYVKCGQGQKSLELYQQMQREGVDPNPVTFVGLVNACASLAALEEGRRIHGLIIGNDCESDGFVGSSLVDMYAKCGSIEDAWKVFNTMPTRNVVAWSAMIMGYVKCRQWQKALDLYQQMQRDGVEPNTVTFVGVLNACASVAALDKGRHIHEEIIQRGFESDVFVASSLIDMYAKCGIVEDALRVFNNMPLRDVVVWSAMIQGYVKCGQGWKALGLYQRMHKEGVVPVPATFVWVLHACGTISALQEGREVHKHAIQGGSETDVFVASSLVDMYAKCGSIEDAWRVFDKTPVRDVVTWTAMIMGFANCGQGQKALKLYRQMHCEGVKPTRATYLAVLNACAGVVALEEGRHIHEQILQEGCDADVYVGSSLIDMYAKCGSIDDACEVFGKMPIHDVVAWTAMLGGYAIHGHAKQALLHFEYMSEEVSEMNGVTFVCLLSACRHAGLMDEGQHYFESMLAVYNISATVEHYTCIVDLLGRVGRLHESEDLIKSIPCATDARVWLSLLSACRVHCNVEMGERIAKQVLELDPGNSAGYVLLSNIHATAGKWDSQVKCSMTQVGKRV